MCTDRLDGGPAVAAEGRWRASFRKTTAVHCGTATTSTAAATATAADHRSHAVLTDGLRADSRGRFGHVVNSPQTTLTTATDRTVLNIQYGIRRTTDIRQIRLACIFFFLKKRKKNARGINENKIFLIFLKLFNNNIIVFSIVVV